jgi:hypothetical protein
MRPIPPWYGYGNTIAYMSCNRQRGSRLYVLKYSFVAITDFVRTYAIQLLNHPSPTSECTDGEHDSFASMSPS